MQKTILAIIALTLFGLAYAQVKSDGACPNVPVQRNLNLSAFMGTWHEYEKYPVSFEGNAKCVSVSRSLISANEMRGVSTLVDPSTNRKFSVAGTSKLNSDGKFEANYSSSTTLPRIYWIVSTDYNSYYVSYACEAAGNNSHNSYVWIFTREPKPSAATIKNARNVLSSNGISLGPLTVTDQSNC